MCYVRQEAAFLKQQPRRHQMYIRLMKLSRPSIKQHANCYAYSVPMLFVLSDLICWMMYYKWWQESTHDWFMYFNIVLFRKIMNLSSVKGGSLVMSLKCTNTSYFKRIKYLRICPQATFLLLLYFIKYIVKFVNNLTFSIFHKNQIKDQERIVSC